MPRIDWRRRRRPADRRFAASRRSRVATARAGAVEPLPPRLDPALLVGALARLAAVTPAVVPLPEAIPRTVSMAERADLIRAALAGAGPVVLQDLLAGVRDRVVVAVTFLAMLELVKTREVVVEQIVPWGPIIVRAVPGAAAPDRAGGRDDPDEEDA